MRTLCTLLVVIAGLPFLLGADVYRWVDKDGVVNYTQQKPEGVEATRLRADAGHRAESAAQQAGDASAGASQSDGAPAASDERQDLLAQLQAAEAARQQEIARARESNCEQSRAVLSRLQEKGRIRVRSEDGDHRVMPEEERQQRIADAQRGVVDNCSGTASSN
jgi:hypothetical protein